MNGEVTKTLVLLKLARPIGKTSLEKGNLSKVNLVQSNVTVESGLNFSFPDLFGSAVQ